MNRFRSLLEKPLHPFLFGAYAVLFLFSQNVGKVENSEVVTPLLVILGGTAVVLLLARLVFRDWYRAALVTTGLSFLFFSYGHIFEVIRTKSLFGYGLDRPNALLVAWAAMAVAGIALVAFARNIAKPITVALNFILVVLVVLSIVPIITGKLQLRNEDRAIAQQPAATGSHGESGLPKRDVYFILLDRYAGAKTLLDHYGYDDPFYDGLRERGFYVADGSRGPYPKTPHSIQTSLNFEFLDGFPKESSDWRKVYNRLKNPKSAQFLKEEGYKYALVGSSYHSLLKDPAADYNFVYKADQGQVWSSFARALYDSTVLAYASTKLEVESLDSRRKYYDRTFFQYDSLKKIDRNPELTYTFAHIVSPHPPFVFDAKGRYVPEDQEKKKTFAQNYIDSIKFTGKKTLDVLDDLMAGPEETRPIIVLQSDEGPGPVGWDANDPKHYEWEGAPQKVLSEKFRILNAYYLPGVDDPGLYKNISPANSFRKVFNLYFDAGLEMLPDRSYIFKHELLPYDFIDVTERVKD